MKILFFKFMSILISIILFLFISEIFLRNFIEPFSRGINIGYFNKKFQQLNYINDKAGFRNPNVLLDADITILGDSFSYGSGLSIDKTYSRILSKKLNKSKKIELYNLSMPSTNLIDQLKLLKNYNLKIGSQLIYQYYYNDIDYLYDLKQFNSVNKINKNLLNYFISMANVSALFDYIFSPIAINYFYKNINLKFDDEIFKKHIDDIKKIFDIANKKNAQIIFLIMPILINESTFDFSKNTYIDYLRNGFVEFCNEGDLLLDISKNLKMNLKPKEWIVNKFDAHASFKGNEIIANELFKMINGKNEDNYLKCYN